MYWEGTGYKEDGFIFIEGLIGGPTHGGSDNGLGEGTHGSGGTWGSNGGDNPRKSKGGAIGSSGQGIYGLPKMIVTLFRREEAKAFQLQLVNEEEDKALTPFAVIFQPLTSALCTYLENSAV